MKYWGKPWKARTWHVFEDSRSLCGQWMMGPKNKTTLEEDDTYRENEDCKLCCRKAGLIE